LFLRVLKLLKVLIGNLANCAGNHWVFVGSNQVHTHYVRALTVTIPKIYEQIDLLGVPSRKKCSYRKPSGNFIAFSDRIKPRLFELKMKLTTDPLDEEHPS